MKRLLPLKIVSRNSILKLIKRLYIPTGKFPPATLARASNVANNTVLCDNKARLRFQRYSIRVTKAGWATPLSEEKKILKVLEAKGLLSRSGDDACKIEFVRYDSVLIVRKQKANKNSVQKHLIISSFVRGIVKYRRKVIDQILEVKKTNFNTFKRKYIPF